MKLTRRLEPLLLLWKGRPFGRDDRPPIVSTLEQLKDSRRILLFSAMPGMLRGDGRLASGLPPGFRYVESGAGSARPGLVSPRRWAKALAHSRSIHRRTKAAR